jgi:Spy/CpxP family protein refolding chaperone
MRLDKTASKLAVVAALAFAFAAQAVASASQPAAGAHRRHVRDRPHGRVS